jgi:hypothetical protein
MLPAVDQIFGVAKTAGTGGQIIDVYVDETAEPFKIEEALKSFTVASGQTITAGTFVDLQTPNLTFGSEFLFRDNWVFSLKQVIPLDNTRAVIIYTDWANSSHGTAVVATTNGTNITFGTPYIFNTSGTETLNAVLIGTNKILINYRNNGNSSRGTSIIGTISGTVITFGSAYVFNSSGTTNYISSAYLTNDKIVIAYRNDAVADTGRAIVGTVNNTVITFGSPITFSSSGTDHISCVYLNTDKVFISYQNRGNSSRGTSIVGTISGTSISFGTANIFNFATSSFISNLFLTNNKVIINYRNDSNGNALSIIANIDGTNITFGTAYVFNTVGTQDISSVLLNNNFFVVVYQDNGNSNLGTAVFGSVSEDVVTFSSEYIFNPASTNSLGIGTFDGSKIIIIYTDAGNNNRGTAIIGDLPTGLIINTTSAKVFGLSKTGGTAGQTIEVYTNT